MMIDLSGMYENITRPGSLFIPTNIERPGPGFGGAAGFIDAASNDGSVWPKAASVRRLKTETAAIRMPD
jgi:hypothetical protein